MIQYSVNMSDGFKLPKHVCDMSYEGGTPSICGTDNRGYKDFMHLECGKTREEGKRINLQLKHEGNCWIWEQYGFETSTVIFVSKLRIDSQTNSTLRLNSLCPCILVLCPCFCSTNWPRKSIYNDCLNFIADFCIYCLTSCSSCWCVLVPA